MPDLHEFLVYTLVFFKLSVIALIYTLICSLIPVTIMGMIIVMISKAWEVFIMNRIQCSVPYAYLSELFLKNIKIFMYVCAYDTSTGMKVREQFIKN